MERALSGGVRFGAVLWMMRTTWPDVLVAAQTAERAGFDDIWVSDHLLADSGPLDDPVFDGPAILSALAASTTRIGLGSLVHPISLRHPALLAKAAVTIDHISGGRLTLGIGAGWLEAEHVSHGIPFGTAGERLDRLAAAVPVIRALISGATTDPRNSAFPFAVRHAPAAVGRLPLLIGGTGERRTLPIVAQFADIWHGNGPLDDLKRHSLSLDRLIVEAGRSPDAVLRSTNRWVAVRGTESEAVAVIQRSLDHHHAGEAPPWRLAAGPIDTVARALAPFVEAGFGHLILSFRSPFDLDTMARLDDIRAALRSIRAA